MDFTMRQRYQILLAQCTYIEKPTLLQLRAVCPHLTEMQIAQLYNSKGRQQFALPPLRVRSLIQVGEYRNTPRDHYLKLHPKCKLVAANTATPYQAEAIRFAEENWPREYIEQTWVSALAIRIANPLQLCVNNRPTVIGYVCLGLTKHWEEISFGNPASIVKRWDSAIAIVTSDISEANEIKASTQSTKTIYSCSNCGGGLLRSSCSGCFHPYQDISSEWAIPLPPKLVTYLESQGHQFKLPPAQLYAS